jgi:hypothetical protein
VQRFLETDQMQQPLNLVADFFDDDAVLAAVKDGLEA